MLLPQEYKILLFTCPECGWSGKGGDLAVGKDFDLDFETEMECPCCDHIFGIVIPDDDLDLPGTNSGIVIIKK